MEKLDIFIFDHSHLVNLRPDRKPSATGAFLRRPLPSQHVDNSSEPVPINRELLPLYYRSQRAATGLQISIYGSPSELPSVLSFNSKLFQVCN